MEIKDFINQSLEKLIPGHSPINDSGLIDDAFRETVLDFKYRFSYHTEQTVRNEILRNISGLPVFLYRLVRKMETRKCDDNLKYQIHSLMKILCGCEIYWSAEIGEGLYIDHALGTVIGSRCKIGKGFYIYHGCTVGHKTLDSTGKGPTIGNNVILCSNSQILGDITIGDNVTVGANSLVINDIEGNQVVAGAPAKRIKNKNEFTGKKVNQK